MHEWMDGWMAFVVLGVSCFRRETKRRVRKDEKGKSGAAKESKPERAKHNSRAKEESRNSLAGWNGEKQETVFLLCPFCLAGCLYA